MAARLVLGGANASYFTTNHFLPTISIRSAVAIWSAPLVILNVAQLRHRSCY